MQDYAFLLQLGFIAVVVLLLGVLLWALGIRFTPPKKNAKGKAGRNGRNRRKRKKSRKEMDDEEEKFFQQAAYEGDGNGPTEFEDSDMYKMKEKKARKGPIDLDDDGGASEKYESWDDY